MLPPNHPLRLVLANEVHARPTEGIVAPATVHYLALVSDASRRDTDWAEARALFALFGQSLPEKPATHCACTIGPASGPIATSGPVRLVLERHNEFIRYTAVAPATTASKATLADITASLGRLSGQVLVATEVTVLPGAMHTDVEQVAATYFGGNVVVGSQLADGAGRALTDFRIAEDGFSRCVVLIDGMGARQSGRMVQRLLEIDTYRMMALLALPTARDLRPVIEELDKELAEIASGIAQPGQREEAALLERLTRLEARAQNALSASHYRFSASAAYHNLVTQRIEDLRERRIEGLQTFYEFTARRLAPAMNTCHTTSENLKDLSQRIAQTTNLLATRVEIVRERQNRELLASMARRAKLQLRLQRTVEGLSIVAVSYYVIGLVAYLIKGLKGAGLGLNVDLMTALLLPAVIAAVAIGLRRLVPERFRE